jgi:glycosidase
LTAATAAASVWGMLRLRLLAPLLPVLATACADAPLGGDSTGQPTMPPDTTPYDPSQGGSAGTYSTTGTDSTPDSDTTPTTTDDDTTGEPPPPMCDDAQKRCDHVFSFPDSGETSVDVMGSFAADGWTNGVPMTSDGTTWTATVPVPWDTAVQYKFRVNGSDTWVVDPANPDSVDDGFGGKNSLLEPTTCEEFSCDSALIGTFDWRDSVIYFVFVDRFNNGNKGNDKLIGVEGPADWYGGDWAGVTAKIEEGYFNELGVNTLWLTVPMDNTNDKGIGTDGHFYSAYHGYWPTNLDATEEHFGTLQELKDLVASAHAHDLKVILDYAMNHVHSSAPVYAEHKDWFWPNDNGQGGNCVCGSGCSWDGEAGKRCWFTDYLPDFNFDNAAARKFSVDNAIKWIQDTGVDGFRLDAVKHIADQWLLDMRARVKADIEPTTMEHFYMVGETFTGQQDTIKYYVRPDMLDGQFDFPLRMQMATSVLMRSDSMMSLASFMDKNDSYYGNGIMSTFIGNHDIPRAIHLAEDTPVWDNQWTDGKDKAWNGKPGLPGGTSAFERLGLAFTILYTTRGAPLVYYGDEVGMPGAGDPDNRRPMQWSGYSAGQEALLQHIKDLGMIRAAHSALRRGTRKTLGAAADTFAYEMKDAMETVYVAINRGDADTSVSGIPAGSYKDELTGAMVEGANVSVPARSARILVKP